MRALNKTLKFDLQKDDHDSFGPSRQIAAPIFFLKHYEPNKFDFCEWNGLIMSPKKNEGILFFAEIRVVGSYTDRLLMRKGQSYLATLVTPQNCFKMLRNRTFKAVKGLNPGVISKVG